MNRKSTSSSGNVLRFFSGTAAIAALLFSVSPGTAQASTTAQAKIVNQVIVTYKDAASAGSFTQKADVNVTVTLVKADLSVSSLLDLAVVAGGTADYINYAITSNANGSDNYKITDTFSAANNLTSYNATFTVYKSDGAGVLQPGLSSSISNGTPAATLASVPIGGAIATASAGAVLSFPGGTLNGNIADNAIVMVGNSGPYRVSGHYYGTGPHVTGAGVYVADDPDTLTLTAFGAGAPLFNADAARGLLVAERVFLKVSVSGIITGTATSSPDGTVIDTITTSDSGNGHTAGTTFNTTTFYGSSLAITKTLSDCGIDTNMGACTPLVSGTSNVAPNHVLEYQITVHNNGHGPATAVQVADAVPAYTTLLAYATSGAAATLTSGANFAKVITDSATDGPTNQNIDIPATSIDATNYGGGSLTAFGRVTLLNSNPIQYERNNVTFWLGASSVVGTGGTLAAGSGATPTPANAPTYTIKYRVKVN